MKTTSITRGTYVTIPAPLVYPGRQACPEPSRMVEACIKHFVTLLVRRNDSEGGRFSIGRIEG